MKSQDKKNLKLPLSHLWISFVECVMHAAPGGQSGDVPKGLCL